MANRYSIIMRSDEPNFPIEVKNCGHDSDNEGDFATVLESAIYAMRGLESSWDNGPGFGGNDPVEMAAILMAKIIEREDGPRGFWNFYGDAEEKAHYAPSIRAKQQLLRAVLRFLKVRREEITGVEATATAE